MRPTSILALLTAVLLAAVTGCPDTNVGVNNSPPEASIIVPEEGFSAPEGTEFSFSGQVNDRLTALTELAVSWSSSLDGQLFEGMADADGNTALHHAANNGQHRCARLLVQAGADRDPVKRLDGPVRHRRAVTPPCSGDVVDARVPHVPHQIVLDGVKVEVRDVVVEALVRLDLRTQP